MNPVIAVSPTPLALPGAEPQAEGTKDSTGKLGALTKADSSGQPKFSAVLMMMFSGTLPAATNPVESDGTDTIPGQPAPTTHRLGRAVKAGDASGTPNAASAANLFLPPVPALPNETQTPETSNRSGANPIEASAMKPAGVPSIVARSPAGGANATAPAGAAPGAPSIVARSPAVDLIEPNATAPAGAPPGVSSNVAQPPVGEPHEDLTAAAAARSILPSAPEATANSPRNPASIAPSQNLDSIPRPPLPTTEMTAVLPALEAQLAPGDSPGAKLVRQEREPAAAATVDSAGPSSVSVNAVEAARTHEPEALATVGVMPSLTLPARNNNVPVTALADQIHDQVSSHMDQLQQMGRIEAQLNLHPPELGRVQLHLTLEDGRLNVRMLVQDENAKRLIDQQLEPLRVRFSEMGVSVGQFDVRRDGSSANPEQQQAAESSVQALQAGSTVAPGRQKSYANIANADAAVDVIA